MKRLDRVEKLLECNSPAENTKTHKTEVSINSKYQQWEAKADEIIKKLDKILEKLDR